MSIKSEREGPKVGWKALCVGALLGLTACACLSTQPVGPYGQIEAATFVAPIDMHRVVLQSIDGRNLPSTDRVAPTASLMIVDPGFVLKTAQSQFTLAPGEHTLSFTAVVNRRDTATWLHPTLRFSPQGAGVLKLNVEAGKRYSVAARVDGARPEEWQAVVYKVEDIKNYRASD